MLENLPFGVSLEPSTTSSDEDEDVTTEYPALKRRAQKSSTTPEQDDESTEDFSKDLGGAEGHEDYEDEDDYDYEDDYVPAKQLLSGRRPGPVLKL